MGSAGAHHTSEASVKVWVVSEVSYVCPEWVVYFSLFFGIEKEVGGEIKRGGDGV